MRNCTGNIINWIHTYIRTYILVRMYVCTRNMCTHVRIQVLYVHVVTYVRMFALELIILLFYKAVDTGSPKTYVCMHIRMYIH